MEVPRSKVELSPQLFEKALTLLQKVELEYKAGSRSFSDVLYVANKIQELFFQHLQSQSRLDSDLTYNETAKLTETADGETIWSKLLRTGDLDLLTSEVPIKAEDLPTENDYLADLKKILAARLAIYPQTFGQASDLRIQANQLIQSTDTTPSDIFNCLLKLVPYK